MHQLKNLSPHISSEKSLNFPIHHSKLFRVWPQSTFLTLSITDNTVKVTRLRFRSDVGLPVYTHTTLYVWNISFLFTLVVQHRCHLCCPSLLHLGKTVLSILCFLAVEPSITFQHSIAVCSLLPPLLFYKLFKSTSYFFIFIFRT